MILWVTSSIDRNSIGIPVTEISYFKSINDIYTQTVVIMKNGERIECDENIVPLTDQYKKLMGEINDLQNNI